VPVSLPQPVPDVARALKTSLVASSSTSMKQSPSAVAPLMNALPSSKVLHSVALSKVSASSVRPSPSRSRRSGFRPHPPPREKSVSVHSLLSALVSHQLSSRQKRKSLVNSHHSDPVLSKYSTCRLPLAVSLKVSSSVRAPLSAPLLVVVNKSEKTSKPVAVTSLPGSLVPLPNAQFRLAVCSPAHSSALLVLSVRHPVLAVAQVLLRASPSSLVKRRSVSVALV